MNSTKALLVICAFVLFFSACAQPKPQQLELTSAAIWLEPLESGLGLLLANGHVYKLENDLELLATDWQGDSLLSCNGGLYGVDGEGTLRDAFTDTSGPLVARHHRPACADENLIVLSQDAQHLLVLDKRLSVLHQQAVNALPDADILANDLDGDGVHEVIVLTDPTERYAHGVLGDRREAASVQIYSATLDLVASYTLPTDFVFEQRRVTTIQLGSSERGILATRSSATTGAGVVLLKLKDGDLRLVSEAPPIGLGNRWLNLFASQDGTAYAIRTPHIGGPLQRYTLSGETLQLEQFQLGVTNHGIGSRNLDLGILLPSGKNMHRLAFISQRGDSIRIIECSTETCEVDADLAMNGRLSSNLTVFQRDGMSYLAASTPTQLWLWILD